MLPIIETIVPGDLIVRLGWTLIHFVWQGALLGLMARACLGLLKGVSPGVRYNLACLFFLAMGAAPVLTFIGLGAAPEAMGSAPAALQSATTGTVTPSVAGGWDWSSRVTSATPWLVLAWAAGVIVFASRLLVGWQRVSRLKVEGLAEAPDHWHHTLERLTEQFGIARSVRLATSVLVNVPTVVGPFRPLILMPASLATGLSSQQIEMILAHELAHVRRHDLLFNLVQVAVQALLFFHPAVHRLAERIRIEREKCCDDMAVTVSGEPVTYANTLAALEEFRQRDLSLGLAASGGQLLDRVQRLVSGHQRPQRGGALLGVVVALTVSAATTITVQDSLFSTSASESGTEATGPVGDAGNASAPASAATGSGKREGVGPSDPETAGRDDRPVDPSDATDADADASGNGPRIEGPDSGTGASAPAPAHRKPEPEPEKTKTAASEPGDPAAGETPARVTNDAGNGGDNRAARETPDASAPAKTEAGSGPSASGGEGPAIERSAENGEKTKGSGTTMPASETPDPSRAAAETELTGGKVASVVQPDYPRHMLRRGKEGRVVVEFTVTRNGKVTNVEIDTTRSTAGFEEAARRAVTQWRFEPFRMGDRPVKQRLSREFVFELEDDAGSGANCRQTGSRINRC